MNHGKINHRIYRSYFSVVGCLCVGSKAVVDLGKRRNTKEEALTGEVRKNLCLPQLNKYKLVFDY